MCVVLGICFGYCFNNGHKFPCKRNSVSDFVYARPSCSFTFREPIKPFWIYYWSMNSRASRCVIHHAQKNWKRIKRTEHRNKWRAARLPCVDMPVCLLNNRLGMIGFLRGHLLEKRPNRVLVDVGGVGYEVQIPLSTFAALGPLKSDTELLIHTHVREDQISLYGFYSATERQCFELLISASGVGPSLALRILSGLSPEELLPAVRKGDLAQLTRVPGVGRKIAERIVVELRDKVASLETVSREARPAGADAEGDLLSALLNLGYERRVAEQAVESTRGGGDFDSMLRAALKQLGRGAPSGTEGHGGHR